MTGNSDINLFNKMVKGDNNAFHNLYQKYYQPLYVFASKFVNTEQAKDIIQDCFYELWRNKNKIEITSSVSAYLFTIVKNRCLKFLINEQKKRQHENYFGLKLKYEEIQFFINSEKSILEFATKDRIEKVIQQMPDKCCEVFKKSRFEGYTNKEIADAFNISVKAVEKHISKALQLFRNEFKDVFTLLIIFLISKF